MSCGALRLIRLPPGGYRAPGHGSSPSTDSWRLLVALLRSDAAAGDLDRNDPDVEVVFSSGPGPHVTDFLQVPELTRLQHPVRLAADRHAPPLVQSLFEMVSLEGDLVFAVRGDQRTATSCLALKPAAMLMATACVLPYIDS